jgi:hypothetical protein
MYSSIHQHVIACKIQDDIETARRARLAKELSREPRAEEGLVRRHWFVRRITTTVSSR